MIRAISAALEDDDSLVRRGALDILLQSLPVNSIAVQKAPHDDRCIIMRAATSVVLRRDLALNRRLYTWLLGSEETSQQQIAYLKANSLGLLTSTLKVSRVNSCRASTIDFRRTRTRCSTLRQNIRHLGRSRYSSHYWTSGRSARR